jgi:hypothetical protein
VFDVGDVPDACSVREQDPDSVKKIHSPPELLQYSTYSTWFVHTIVRMHVQYIHFPSDGIPSSDVNPKC